MIENTGDSQQRFCNTIRSLSPGFIQETDKRKTIVQDSLVGWLTRAVEVPLLALHRATDDLSAQEIWRSYRGIFLLSRTLNLVQEATAKDCKLELKDRL